MPFSFQSKLIRLKLKQEKSLGLFTKLKLQLLNQNEELMTIENEALELIMEYQEVLSNAGSLRLDNVKQIEKINQFLGKDDSYGIE